MQWSPIPRQLNQTVVIPQDRPVYKAITPCYFEDELLPVDTVFAWEDEPNEEMQPMNHLAAQKMQEFLEKLDRLGRAAAEKAGKSYANKADAHANSIELARQDAKKFEVLSKKEIIPLMGAKKRGRPPIQKVQAEAVAPLMGSGHGKLSLNAETTGRDAVNKIDGKSDG